MFEYLFKGFSCISTGHFSYQIIEDETGLRLFTNDLNPLSYLYEIESIDLMTYSINPKEYAVELMSSPDPRNSYFRYLVSCNLSR